jgi:inosine-uridine nucleoside N-ribohydrolase
MDTIRVHLDTDLGGDLDDLCALALLLAWPGVEITGVTTVLENDGRRAGYARRALDLAGRPGVPVAAGAGADLPRFRARYGLPSEGRYWPEPVRPLPGPVDGALDLLKESLDRDALVIAIGPFTNLSLLEERHPGVLGRARLCMMGGHVNPAPPGFPAWSHEMDFNVQADHRAARHVLECSDPTLVPIEVTAQTALRRAHLPALRQAGRLGELIARQAEAFAEDERIGERYGRTCAGLPEDIVNFQHDGLACAVALGWPGASVETLPLVLGEAGGWLRARVDPEGRPFRVATRVDGEGFGALWLERVTRPAGSGP